MNRSKMHSGKQILRITMLTAALLGVYGTAQAAPLILHDGQPHEVGPTSGPDGNGHYEFVKVEFQQDPAVDKTKSTTLTASGLTITDDRGNPNGAVFTKGGEI